MRILSMTATFGKLEHETLTLEPGLNVLARENEWGKSTWCAFLLAMLYGLDTRAKSTKTDLAPKERYAPWSGLPMSGRMDIRWQGRNITLERGTKGRIPMGDFRAYETDTGLYVPELTAENCGQVLLGVEREVFCRAGFIRQADLPVTGSEALRARLTALVTTGDDSGDSRALAEGLKTLKNKCKYNKSGLLPAAQSQQAQLEETLRELDALEDRREKLTQRQQEGEAFQKRLQNHLQALEQTRAQQDARQVAQAQSEYDRASREVAQQEARCRELPGKQEAQIMMKDLTDYVAAWDGVRAAQESMEPEPKPVECLPVFRGLTIAEAKKKAEEDAADYRDSEGRYALVFGIFGTAFLAFMVAAMIGKLWILSLALGGAGIVLMSLALLWSGKGKSNREALSKGYGTADWKRWPELAEQYARQQMAYSRVYESWHTKKSALDNRKRELTERKEALCGDRSLSQMQSLCREVLQSWERLEAAKVQMRQAKAHLDAMKTMVREVGQAVADDLHLTQAETQDCLRATQEELSAIRHDLGMCRGRMEALGNRERLEAQLAQTRARAEKLQNLYDALQLAQETLTEATQTLQRRFAPRISQMAGDYMQAMTDGKYTRLTLTENMTLLASGAREDTMREALWRSDGTADQLYLAVRLAVANILTPQAPLVLDDALVRFDDRRLQVALRLLEAQGQDRQVILFTCQHREEAARSEIRSGAIPDTAPQSL